MRLPFGLFGDTSASRRLSWRRGMEVAKRNHANRVHLQVSCGATGEGSWQRPPWPRCKPRATGFSRVESKKGTRNGGHPVIWPNLRSFVRSSFRQTNQSHLYLMRTHIRSRTIPFVAVATALLTAATANAASLIGHVVDAESGAPLPGVVVSIPGTRQGAQSDLDGHYRLDNLVEGPTTVRADLLGYETLERRQNLADGVNTLDLRMQPEPIHLGETLVRADRALSAASSRAVRDFDLAVRPRDTAHQLLQTAPGLIIAQHAGGGKAEQIFLRNFDADHGTDVAITVDGMPVNMVSHGHGQGYADLHFVIPDVVEGIDVYKGPYFAQFGNLATAGAVAFRTRSHLPENLLRVEGGSFGTTRATVLYQLPIEDPDQSVYFAGEYYGTDGPVDEPQDLRRMNVFAKYHTHLSERAALTIDAGGFTSSWFASGQIPERAVRQGLIDRFGSLDALEGGGTSRQNLNITFRAHGARNARFTSRVYANWYDFKLFSNFTYFLEDPALGDMIEQADERSLFGVDNQVSFYHDAGAVLAQTHLGGGLRADNVDVSLWHSPGRERRSALVDADIAERNAYLWAQEQLFLHPQVRLLFGLRADLFTFDVNDHLEGQPASLPHASGVVHDEILSPKVGLVYSPTTSVDLFANAGSGFHSNDARAVVIGQRARLVAGSMRANGATPAQIDSALQGRNIDAGLLTSELLPRALGAEIGARWRLASTSLGAALWWMDLEEEFVFVGDGGGTEASGQTRRLGVDLEARSQLLPWLWADADVTLSQGQLTDEPSAADEIPLAPRVSSQGGLTARHDTGWDASLRYRFVGDRPANENDTVTAEGHFLLGLDAAYRFDNWRLHVGIDNLLDREWNEAQFDTESRLIDETQPVSELHFTPGAPRSVRVGVSYLP